MSTSTYIQSGFADLKHAWQSLSKWNRWAITILLASGSVHVPLFVLSSIGWEEPTSFRKPILFGLSTGLTLWSCLWVLGILRPHRWDQALGRLLSGSLVAEVALITLQAWRGTSSHFNRNGVLNVTIELLMLLLIVLATAIIVWITVRTFLPGQLCHQAPHDDVDPAPAMRLAVRQGMLLLVISCLLGFAITAIGKSAQSQGLAPEIFGQRGILKFPHGAALHAIQTLVLLAWFCNALRQPNSWLCIASAVMAHYAWLLYALTQTFRGRARWEFDAVSYLLLVITLGATLLSISMFVSTLRKLPKNRTAGDQLPSPS